MANLKRRPDKDLNHENWDEEDAAEDKGEFKKATEDDLRGRKILVPRRKAINASGSGRGASSAVSKNPFSAFAFQGTPAVAALPLFGIPTIPVAGSGEGGSGSLFKLAGITPSSEPPTKASADSSTADTRSEASASGLRTERQPESEPEVSESDGITEESSNSSSLPWNVSSKLQEKEAAEERERAVAADSMQNAKSGSDKDLNNDESSSEALQSRKVAQTAPADSSESSSASNPHPSSNPFSAFSFGNTFGAGSASGSLFRPFASASAAVAVSQSAAESAARSSNQPTSGPLATSAPPPEPSQPTASSGGDTRSPESSGILVRSSIEEDSADYENDTTSSSNKLLMSENEVSNDFAEGGAGGAENNMNVDREAEAETNEEREAEGVDS